MEKEVLKQENENVMGHVSKGNHKMSGPVTIKSRVTNKINITMVETDSGRIGVTGVHALVHVKRLLGIDGEIVKPVGINAMDKLKKLLHVKCQTVMGIKIIIGKHSLEHGQIGQIGQIVPKRVELVLFIDRELVTENKRDVKISLAES